MATALPAPTTLDRVIGQISPAWLQSRLAARVQLARYEGLRMDVGTGTGYDPVGLSRTALSRKRTEGSADKAILRDLSKLRGISGDLVRNQPIAAGALENIATKVVGHGLQLRARPDRKFLGIRDDQAAKWEAQAERLWRHFCGRCDYQRQLPFEIMEFVILFSMLEDGDHFVLLTADRNPGDLFDLKLQMIEAARVCNPMLIPDTYRQAGGFEYDAAGKPQAVQIADRFPYDYGRGPEPSPTWTRVPLYGAQSGRRNILRIFAPTRANQTRGVPILATVMEALSQLGDYTRAEMMAAVVNSCFAIVSKTEGNLGMPTLGVPAETQSANPGKPPIQRAQIPFTPGMVVEGLMPNESITSFDPKRPAAGFDPFVSAMAKQIAVGLGLSTGTLMKTFTASYSASRGELLEVWEIVMRRRAQLAKQLHQPLYEELLAEAIDAGEIVAPGWDDPLYREAWCRSRWIGPAQGQLNPYDEVKAASLRVAANFSTEEEETARLTGGDWDSNIEQRAREVAIAKQLGIAPYVTITGADPNRPGQTSGGQPAGAAALPAPTDEASTTTDSGDSDTETPAPGSEKASA